MTNCASVKPNMGPQYALILAQVSVSAAICQYVQSTIVSGDAVLGGSTKYAAPRQGRMARPRASGDIMVQVFEVLFSPTTASGVCVRKCGEEGSLYVAAHSVLSIVRPVPQFG
jgi:hypothetical protein